MNASEPAMLPTNASGSTHVKETTMDVDMDVNGNEISKGSKRVA
jgi:hypothetical protein